MLVSPRLNLYLDTLAARRASAQLSLPPAKRAKTGSSSSIPRAVDSPELAQFDSRHKKAQRWLDHADKSHMPYKGDSFVDDDPPFGHKSTVESNVPAHGSDASMQDHNATIGPTAPTASLLAQIDARHAREDREHGSDDFRSVIDDLTVQNKKLKRKLQKYEKLHCSHLQKEKLFEVRIHGLPADKKRELEDTLRSFASSIDNSAQSRQAVPTLKPSSTLESPALQKPPSSSTSESRPIDSAYASMAGTQSHQPHLNRNVNSKSTQSHVKSFLNDIPEMLRPSNVLGMSEKTKSRLVVRRLEQIFTGRGSASHRHNQSQQQQEVSTAAAEAERSKIEACGQRVWREGTREAHILPDAEELQVDSAEEINARAQKTKESSDGMDSQTRPAEISRAGSPEQRPTRPLDLDIHRAQVPSDNIEYIRHLGLASPTNGDEIMTDGDNGWVYLNLLISMAQLHTLNVTPEFTRKAIKARSQKFELSPDGTKVKWLGGTEGSRLSVNDDGDDGLWRSSESSVSVSKLGSTDALSSKEDVSITQAMDANADDQKAQAGAKRLPIHMGESNSSDRFQYRPMFHHASPADEDAQSEFDSDSATDTNSMEYGTGFNSSSNAVHERQRRFRGRKHDNGPIIFYQRAKFCTDLGGNPNWTIEDVSYERLTQYPLGCSMPHSEDESSEDHRPVSFVDATKVDSTSVPSTRSALDLDDLWTSISTCDESHLSSSPMSMEACGLGGVQPSDNFVVKVQTRRRRKSMRSPNGPTSAARPPTSVPNQILHTIPRSSIDALRNKQSDSHNEPSELAPITSELVSAVKTTMPPSTLPPPSYALFPFSSSSNSSSSSPSEQESSSGEDYFTPKQRLNNAPGSSDNAKVQMRRSQQPRSSFHPPMIPVDSSLDTETKESSYAASDDDDDDSDDGSIDLLAHARMQDPEAVKAREMEWEKRISGEGEESDSASVAATDGTQDDSESDADSMSVDGEEGGDG